MDENKLSQSVAICRFLGKRFGLATDDPLKEALLEAVVDNMRDVQISKKIIRFFVSMNYYVLSTFQNCPRSS